MRIIYSLVLALAIYANALAQDGVTMTLDECIQYAMENSKLIQNAALDEQIAGARIKETVGIGLPQITGSIGVQHNHTLPRFFSEYNPDGGFTTLSPEQANDLGIQAGDVFAAENFFQLQSAGDMNLTVNQLIFNGSYLVGLKASKTYKQLSEKYKVQTEEEVIFNVSKAYYNVLINEERLELFESNITRLDSLYNNTKALYTNGFAEKIDVDRIKVSLNNVNTDKKNFELITELSYTLLKFQMNFPFSDPMALDGSIDAMIVEDLPTDNVVYSDRPDYQVLQSQKELQELNLKNKYAEAVPFIGAFATMGRNTQSPNVGGVFQTNTNINDANGIGPDSWYGYSVFGVNLTWNLFTGLSRRYQIQQEKIEIQKIDNGFDILEKQIQLETQQSGIELSNAKASLDVQKENMELAESIAYISKTKYESGVGSNLEIIEAENSLKEAQTNYYEALYNAVIAKINLQKATGKLYQK